MQQVLAAKALLGKKDVAVNIWSVTSYNELYREAEACRRWNRLHLEESPKISYIAQQFQNEQGVVVATSDYMKTLAGSIAPWIPQPYTVLGTDGFGISESREDLREYFEISPQHIAFAGLEALAREQQIDQKIVIKARDQWQINPDKTDPINA